MSTAQRSAKFHEWLHAHKGLLLATMCLAVALCSAPIWNMRVSENVLDLLPDDNQTLAQDLWILRSTSLFSKVLITITAHDEATAADLPRAARALANALGQGRFSKVVFGPEVAAGPEFINLLLGGLPRLAAPQELESLLRRSTLEQVERRVSDLYATLLSPAGWAAKPFVRQDPLGFRDVALSGLGRANPLPGVRVRDGAFVSADGRHALLVAVTPVEVTNSAEADEVIGFVERAAAATLPPAMRASMLSGHLYAAANAAAIKDDLVLVTVLSSISVLAVILVFLRTFEALWVYLVPALAPVFGAAAVALGWGEVSGITLGFGAVLLGMADDFAVHVFTALKRSSAPLGQVMASLTKPVLLCGITTMGAFAVLLLSPIPAQQQLAVFSVAGLAGALALSLLVLPHVITRRPLPAFNMPLVGHLQLAGNRWLLGLWIGLLLFGAWEAARIGFDGGLRSMGVKSARIQAAEEEARSIWGDVRGKAMAVVVAPGLETALEANDTLQSTFRAQGMDIQGIGGILPGLRTQQANLDRWRAAWSAEAPKVVEVMRGRAAALGFTQDAFEPFEALLRGEDAGPITRESLTKAGMGAMLEPYILTLPDGRAGIVSYVADTPQVAQALAGMTGTLGEAATIRLVSQRELGAHMGHQMRDGFLRFLVLELVFVFGLLWLTTGTFREALAAQVPVVTGLAVMAIAMGFAGKEWTLYSISGALITVGLAVDYGIFMVERLGGVRDMGIEQAALTSGLTTVLAFGSLALASHPAMNAIGFTVLTGLGGALASTFLIMPLVYGPPAPLSATQVHSGTAS